MKNILGLFVVLIVASAVVFGVGRLIGASGPGLAIASLIVGMAVTRVYDSEFGTGSDS